MKYAILRTATILFLFYIGGITIDLFRNEHDVLGALIVFLAMIAAINGFDDACRENTIQKKKEFFKNE